MSKFSRLLLLPSGLIESKVDIAVVDLTDKQKNSLTYLVCGAFLSWTDSPVCWFRLSSYHLSSVESS